jgi:aminotransferase in exopolysaccharide biosynthesis
MTNNVKEIPLSVPNLNIDILDNLRECIETGWVSTGGRFITEFERKLAKYVVAWDAVSTQSGTAGLHLSLIAADVKAGEEVVVPALTFIAAVNPVKYMGAAPVFMDCDDSLCMDGDKLENFFRKHCTFSEDGLTNNLTKKRISAIIVVHVFGNMANMERIMEIAAKYRLPVIEDATEALGTYYISGRYKGKFAGTIGNFGVYSFNANKIITTGGGGMVVAQNQGHLDKIRYLSITAKDDSLYFVHNDIGYNYRMLNIQAALGVSQIDELEKFIEIKKRNYEHYQKRLAGTSGIRLLPFSSEIRPNYWFYSLLIDKAKYGFDRDELMNKLLGANVQCRPVWKLTSDQKPYVSALSFNVIKAKEYEKTILNIPCSTNLKEEQIERICEIISAI